MSKRDIIYKAGVDEISKRGFFNTRVQDIVDAANLSIGTFYNYFEDKNHFLFSIYIDMETRFYNNLKSISYLSISEVDKVLQFFEGLLKEVLINKNAFKVYLSERFYLSKILDDEKLNVLDKLTNQIKTLFTSIILEGQKKKLIKDTDPSFVIIMIQSLIRSTLLENNYGTRPITTDEMKKFILDAIKL